MKRRGRRVWDTREKRFVTGWLGRTEARTARNTLNLLGGHDPAGPGSRYRLTGRKK